MQLLQLLPLLVITTGRGLVGAARLAIVGAGPVGLFLVAKLLDCDDSPFTEIDMYEAAGDPRAGGSDRSYAIGIGRRSFAALGTVPGLDEFVTEHATQAIKHSQRFSGWKSARDFPNVNNATHTWISNQVLVVLSRHALNHFSAAPHNLGPP